MNVCLQFDRYLHSKSTITFIKVRLEWLPAGNPRRKELEWGKGPSLAITTMFCLEFAYVFRLSVSMRKVASEHPFCVLICMNSYIFHIYCVLFIFLSNKYLVFDRICMTLSLADTHGIAKYARTNIRRYRDTHTHTHTHKHKVERVVKKKEKGKGKNKEGGVR